LLSNDPPWVECDIDKIVKAMLATSALGTIRTAAPLHLASLVGLHHWHAQLTRWHFSYFNHVYEFQRREPGLEPQLLPGQCLDELLAFAAAAPLMCADLERPFLPLLPMSDASPSYGFGLSVRQCEEDVIRDLYAKSTQRGHFLTLDDVHGKPSGRSFAGEAVHLPFAQSSFTGVLSIPARRQAHAGALEAHGLLLMVKWILRSASRLGRRVVAGVDARTVLFAATKGRTSAPSLRGPIRSIAAHALAGNLQLHLLWVPSEFNPSDGASTGHRRRPPVRRAVRKTHLSSPDRALRAHDRAFARLRATGVLAGGNGAASDCSWA